MPHSASPACLRVGFDEKPFHVFVVNARGERWLGRKKPVRLGSDSGSKPRIGCLVTPAMLLGRLGRIATLRTHYFIGYEPMDPGAAGRFFAQLDERSEIVYPLVRLIGGSEVAKPPAFWDRFASNAAAVDRDEEAVREAVCRLLRGRFADTAVIYDPACSTGAFLARLKAEFPRATIVGQDRSEKMVALARQRLGPGAVHLGDSARPACPPASVDVAVVRHLNSDVVTSTDARRLFGAVAATVRPGGLMVLLGHTPVLLECSWMENQGFEAITRCGFASGGEAAFQLYTLRRD